MDDAHRPDDKKGDTLLPPVPWHQRTREFPHLREDALGYGGSAPSSKAEPFIILGRDAETDTLITIGDTARRTGCYIVGRSGTGKSTLLVNMIDQDLKNGHGVFFLDPHGEAITELLQGGPTPRLERDLILLDPEDPTHSFGINLFACRDLADRGARTETYRRVYDIFQKLWEHEWKERPWLQLMVQYVIYVFLENPEYTLADVPRFLRDPDFREHLVANVKYNWEAQDFWRYAFHDKQREAMETRVFQLLGDPFVKHIICQRQTTLNFAELMEKRQIVCVRLSLRLPADVKTFIGTILISELMQAVQHRADLPPEKRHQFSLFVDEFQTFAGYQDFAVLFTQARKLGIATTVAHQERYGQFGENKAILGATDAAGNKIFFQLTVRDATEQAQEFAKPPPMEKRREPLVSIVNTPFDFLILGHYNEEIRRFARKYLLPLKYRQNDLEAARALMDIERSVTLQVAEIHRLNAQIDALYEGKGKAREQQLMEAKAELLNAKRLTEAMKDWWHQRRVTTQTIRYLNSIIVAIEEGELRPWPGNERFCEFLIDCARHSSFVPWPYVEVLTLYLSLVYGDPSLERTIPVAFAKRQGVFPEEITHLLYEAAEKTRRVWEHVWQWHVSVGLAKRLASLGYQAEKRQKEQALRIPLVTQQLSAADIRYRKSHWGAPSVYLTYVWLLAFPDLATFLAPYRTSRFDYKWGALVGRKGPYGPSRSPMTVNSLIQDLARALREGKASYELPFQLQRELQPWAVTHLLTFLQQHGEGAFVMLALLDAALAGSWARFRETPCTWQFVEETNCEWRTVNWCIPSYPNFCLADFPGIAGTDPLELLQFLQALNARLRAKCVHKDALANAFLPYFQIHDAYYNRPRTGYDALRYALGERHLRWLQREEYFEYLKDQELYPFRAPSSFPTNLACSVSNHVIERAEVRLLTHVLATREGVPFLQSPAALALWTRGDDLTRSYLTCRACDLVTFGEPIANVTFPAPRLAGAEELVAGLARLLQEKLRRIAVAEKHNALESARPGLEHEAMEKAAEISFPLPDHLPPRVFSDDERERVKNACLAELAQGKDSGWDAQKTLQVIDEFARFCWLMSHPDNHILSSTGQYTEQLVPSRTVRDMIDEMSQELTNLPLYTAYAKILQEQDGIQVTLKRKLLPLPPLPQVPATHDHIEAQAIARTHDRYCTDRDALDEELRARHDAWRQAAHRSAAHWRKRFGISPAFKAPGGSEEPPPTLG